MTRKINFTQAQVRRAVEAAESAGLKVRGVRVCPDGSIEVQAQSEKMREPQENQVAERRRLVL